MIGYITPKDMLAGHQQEIQDQAGPEVGDGKRTAGELTPNGLRDADNLLFADDSGALPLTRLNMSFYRRFPPLLLPAEDLA